MFGKDSFLRSWLCQFLTTLILIAGMTVSAAPPGQPQWWSEPDADDFKVIDPNIPDPNPNGVANIGQAKYMAKRALEALSAAVGANPSLQAQVVTPIQQELYKPAENSTEGVFYPVRPATPDEIWLAAQKVSLQIGALKALAAPFYRHLSAMNADWVKDQLIANGLTLGSSFFLDTDGTYYPWNPADNANLTKNRAPATIGQLKAVFSLRFESLAESLNPDLDGDGLTNVQEVTLGTNPNNSDSDGDGMKDGWEVSWGLNPLLAADAETDLDGDGVSNLSEFQISTPPTGLYRVEIVATDLSSNEFLSGASPDGALALTRTGSVSSIQGAPKGSGSTSDWLNAQNASMPITRVALPLGQWNITGVAPEAGTTAYYLAEHGKVRMHHKIQRFAPNSQTPIEEAFYLIDRDVFSGSQTEISWVNIKAALQADGWASTTLGTLPTIPIVSPQGGRMVLATGAEFLVLDQAGNCVGELPDSDSYDPDVASITWLAINEQGQAMGRGMPGNRLVYWSGGYLEDAWLNQLPLPSGWDSSAWTLMPHITEDSTAVVERTVTHPDSSTSREFLAAQGGDSNILTVNLPSGATSIAAIAANRTILYSGTTPSISRSGAPVMIQSLAIQGAVATDAHRRLSEMGWQAFNPVHIGKTGTITGNAVLQGGANVVFQLIPVKDSDNDGIADDMEKYLAKAILENNPDLNFWGTYYAGLVAGNLDPNHDYTNDGMTAVQLVQTLADNSQVFEWNQPIASQLRGRWVRTIATQVPASGSTPESITGVFQQSAIFGNFFWYSTTPVNNDAAILSPQYLDDHFETSVFTEFVSVHPLYLSTRALTGSDGYAISSSFDVTSDNGRNKYIGRSNQVEVRAIAKSPSHEPFEQDYYAVTMKDPVSLDGTGPVLDIEKFTLSIPRGRCLSIPSNGFLTPWRKFKAPMTPGQNTVIQIETPLVLALSPQVTDETGQAISSSEYPSYGKKMTPFVEVNPATDKIAHRELLVSFGWSLKGKKVRWTQAQVPGAVPAAIRGGWDQSPTHKDCFEASADFPDRCTFARISQAEGETTVGDDGYAAIRVNVPPIGFNKVRIMIKVEDTDATKLIDMEVPGVVVIDPGHGGKQTDPTVGGSSWNNATSPSGKYEKDMTLAYGLGLRDALIKQREEEHLNLRVFMTRNDDHNVSGINRAHKARDNGADIINIIHFNSDDATEDDNGNPRTPHRSRGTLQVTQHNNTNAGEDTTTSNTIISRVVTAIRGFDAAGNQRAPVATPTDVAEDLKLGNLSTFHPIRAPYIEVEFIDYGANTVDKSDDAVDILMNTGPKAGAAKTAIAEAMKDGIIHDLRTHVPSN
jgi:N-acetylmuramoyl-L-alanine amidase